MRTIQDIETGVQTMSLCDIDERKKNIRSMIRMLMYEIELLDAKMNGHIINLQNDVDDITINNMVPPIQINNIHIGSFVRMVDRKDMYYDKIGKVVNMRDYFIIINMAFGRVNERGIFISRQPDEVILVVN